MVSDIKDGLHNISGKDKTDDYALNHMIQEQNKRVIIMVPDPFFFFLC